MYMYMKTDQLVIFKNMLIQIHCISYILSVKRKSLKYTLHWVSQKSQITKKNLP